MALESNSARRSSEDEQAIRRRIRGRLRWRFHLSSLLLALLLATAYFGIRERLIVSREEPAARERLLKEGAIVTVELRRPAWQQYALLQFGEEGQAVTAVTFPPQDVHSCVIWPYGRSAMLTAESLEPISRLSRPQVLGLGERLIADATLVPVSKCASLIELDLHDTLVNDEGVRHLASLRNLRSLRIHRTLTTDESLRTIAQLPALEEISLDDATTEKGIRWLAEAPRLKRVDARGTGLLPEHVRPLTERGVTVELADLSGRARARFAQDDPWKRRESPELDLDLSRHVLDEAFYARLRDNPKYRNIVFWGRTWPSKETLRRLVTDPQITLVRLHCVGPPLDRRELVPFLEERPENADACMVEGNVAVSGAELLEMCPCRYMEPSSLRLLRTPSSGPAYFRFVVHTIPETTADALVEAAPDSGIRVVTYAPNGIESDGYASSQGQQLYLRALIFTRLLVR